MSATPQAARKFTDKFGNVWDLTIDLGLAYEFDAAHEWFDPMTKSDNPQHVPYKASLVEPPEQFLQDLLTYTRARTWTALIYFICAYQDGQKPSQIEANKILDRTGKPVRPFVVDDGINYDEIAQVAFMRCFDGKTLRKAWEALYEALVDFFPHLSSRLSVSKKHEQTTLELIDREMPNLSEKTTKAAEKQMALALSVLDEAFSADTPEMAKSILEAKLGNLSLKQ